MKVGITLPLAEYPGKQPSCEEVRALARQAEAAGFDSLWCFDHPLFREDGEPAEGIWECWTTLSALAEATSRIQLGTLVLCTAFRNPAVLGPLRGSPASRHCCAPERRKSTAVTPGPTAANSARAGCG